MFYSVSVKIHFYFFCDISVIFWEHIVECLIFLSFEGFSMGICLYKEMIFEWESFPDLLASSFLNNNCLGFLWLWWNNWGRSQFESMRHWHRPCLVGSHCGRQQREHMRELANVTAYQARTREKKSMAYKPIKGLLHRKTQGFPAGLHLWMFLSPLSSIPCPPLPQGIVTIFKLQH